MRIGVDMGGTKIEAVVLDAKGRVVARRRRATPHGDYEATLAAVAKTVAAAERAAGFAVADRPVGVGMPGALSLESGLVKNANSTCLIGRPLERDLAAVLGRPVRLANDADLFALSEAVDGAAKGAAVVFGVILGTGVGGGIAIDGRVLSGPNAVRGEWGHNPLPWPQVLPPEMFPEKDPGAETRDERPGPACYCGLAGCIETFLSGPGLARDYAHHGGRGGLSGKAVAARAARREPAARLALRRYEHRLARALAHVINIVDPDVIVLGGGLSEISSLYRRLPKLWDEWVFSDSVCTRLRKNRHGASSGVRGAAWLWEDS
jgi:fructokinase